MLGESLSGAVQEPSPAAWLDSAYTARARGSFTCYLTPQRFQQGLVKQVHGRGNGEERPQRQAVNWPPLPIGVSHILCRSESSSCSPRGNSPGSYGHTHYPLTSVGVVFQEVGKRSIHICQGLP